MNRRRLALIFGNEDYSDAAKLKSCVKDADDMAATLTSLGFQCTKYHNLNKRSTDIAIRDFCATIEDDDCILIYFSGHGMEAYRSGNNLLNIIILDACRFDENNDTWKIKAINKQPHLKAAFGNALTPHINIPKDSQFALIFSSDPGTVSYSGEEGGNSFFTSALLNHLATPQLEHSLINGHNFGKTIGISYDPTDHKTVEMIEHELNKYGLRVWTIYDHMNDNFIPSFISLMNSTQYLIVCLSDMYRLNNRCRTELLYATASGHRVLSWKVHTPTNNSDNDEQIRIHAIKTLLQRIIPNDIENIQTTVPSIVDTEHVNIHVERRSIPTNLKNYRRTKEIMSLENWTNTEVLAWCELINLPGFLKLLTNFDGQSVIRLYEFCKQNSTETISLLNNDLHHICQQDHISDIQISVHEFIRFQIEVEKLLSITSLRNSSISLSSSKVDIYKNRLKIKTCSIL
ncbi:unnamed protein product [Rotaria sp. Silwood1]|nr:unnamed protein product [Rotaria sp. Silwood1]